MKCLLCKASLLLLIISLFSSVSGFSQSSIVPTGSVWKYFDAGFAPSGWKALDFNDAGWSAGPGELGYGDGDEATTLGYGGNPTNKFISYYFRHKFMLPDPSAYKNLLLRLRRDDGAVVYLNEVEVFRSNMPPGPVNNDTPAAALASDEGKVFFANPVSTALLLSGDNILAVEVHQNTNTSSDISFDLDLTGNVAFQPPTISLAVPPEASSYGAADLRLWASASDADGAVTLVEFYSGNTLLGSDATAPFALTNFNVPVGTYVLRAVATDSTGLSSTSAPVSVTVVPRLVPSGANWKYLDDGSNQGSAWHGAGFDDSGWSNGVAQLGFGDGDEATRINGGPDTNRFMTTYFRHAFTVPAPGSISNLVVRLRRDDGGVVYLNGTEIFRNNMPAGPVTYLTAASTAIDDDAFYASPVSSGLLVPGLNLLAVEIHQANATSSDLSFDLELRPNVLPTPPVATLTAPANNATFFGPLNVTNTAVATDLDDPVVSVAFYDGPSLLGVDTTAPYAVVATNLALGTHVLRVVATDLMGLNGTSAPVNVTVLRPAIQSTLIATGSVWRYLDSGIDQGIAWQAPGFDDSLWPQGTAKFGSNDTYRTFIHISEANRTTYFRTRFTVTNASSITNLGFRVLRDDGVVAYLNGTEIFRSNMQTNPISFATFAPTAIGGTNENFYVPLDLSGHLLVEGVNSLAVELHQAMNTSDAGFDLGLVGTATPTAGPPPIAISFTTVPTPSVILSWTGTGFILQQSDQVKGNFTDLPAAVSPHAVAPAGVSKFYRLRSP